MLTREAASAAESTTAARGRRGRRRLLRPAYVLGLLANDLLATAIAFAAAYGLLVVTNERAVRWMEPGAEGNRVGYHRVTRSRLKVGLANGGTRELELTSLISWRGAWYVVHLHGFS